MPLLPQEDLPTRHIGRTFKSTTNSYKFYWFLAILDELKANKFKPELSMSNLLVRMVSLVWYPVNKFRLSFGQSDQLSTAVQLLQKFSELSERSEKPDIITTGNLFIEEDNEVSHKIDRLSRYVPYRFLRPWFSAHLSGLPDNKVNSAIADYAEKEFHGSKEKGQSNLPIYKFTDEKHSAILIQPRWLSYIEKHHMIIEGYVLWELTEYLQKRNPHVPAISEKLMPPVTRNLTKARNFWQRYIKQNGYVECIFTGENLVDRFDIDHFLPWSFVCHDQFWNLIPAAESINRTKSDAIPDKKKIEDISLAHFNLMQQYSKTVSDQKLFQDYLSLFPKSSLSELPEIEKANWVKGYKNHVSPQIEIALSMGFPKLNLSRTA